MIESEKILINKKFESKNIISKEEYIDLLSYEDQFVGFKTNQEKEIESVIVISLDDIKENNLTIKDIKDFFKDFSFFKQSLGEEISLSVDSNLETINRFNKIEEQKIKLENLTNKNTGRTVKGGDGRSLNYRNKP